MKKNLKPIPMQLLFEADLPGMKEAMSLASAIENAEGLPTKLRLLSVSMPVELKKGTTPDDIAEGFLRNAKRDAWNEAADLVEQTCGFSEVELANKIRALVKKMDEDVQT